MAKKTTSKAKKTKAAAEAASIVDWLVSSPKQPSDREYYVARLVEARRSLEAARADLEIVSRAANRVLAAQTLVDTYEACLRDLTTRGK